MAYGDFIELQHRRTTAARAPGMEPDADWVRNLRRPRGSGAAGARVVHPKHRFLSDDESFNAAVQFRSEHPWRLRLLSAVLGWEDLHDDDAVREFTRTHPFVALRPAASPPT